MDLLIVVLNLHNFYMILLLLIEGEYDAMLELNVRGSEGADRIGLVLVYFMVRITYFCELRNNIILVFEVYTRRKTAHHFGESSFW